MAKHLYIHRIQLIYYFIYKSADLMILISPLFGPDCVNLKA